jgi:glucose-6-phosphate dehydrogenase assembly protein OpcA
MSQLPVALPSRSVNVAAIERELAQLWSEPQPGSEQKPEMVTRAVMSNVIIFAAAHDSTSVTPTEIAEIVQLHPCRILLLIADTERSDDQIEAHVSAHCHFAGGGRQVVSEHITVSASGKATRRLPSAARSLLLGDLPTALWWAVPQMPPPMGGELFQELSLMVDQVIYESVGWLDPVRGVVAVAEWAGSDLNEQVVSDLQWRRLKLWRRFISQVLAPEVLPEALQTVTEVRLEHGPHGLPQSWLLIGWLAARLGWKPNHGQVRPGVEITWQFQSERGPVKIVVRRLTEGAPGVLSADIRWKTPSGAGHARFTRPGPERLQVSVNDSEPRSLVAPVRTRSALIGRQLPDLERDAVFLETLQHSASMATTLL